MFPIGNNRREGDQKMPAYNTSFDLDVDDMEIIEAALRERKKELSLERLTLLGEDETAYGTDDVAALDAAINATHELLGRLHNQKVFYRPKTVKEAPYISG